MSRNSRRPRTTVSELEVSIIGAIDGYFLKYGWGDEDFVDGDMGDAGRWVTTTPDVKETKQVASPSDTPVESPELPADVEMPEAVGKDWSSGKTPAPVSQSYSMDFYGGGNEEDFAAAPEWITQEREGGYSAGAVSTPKVTSQPVQTTEEYYDADIAEETLTPYVAPVSTVDTSSYEDADAYASEYESNIPIPPTVEPSPTSDLDSDVAAYEPYDSQEEWLGGYVAPAAGSSSVDPVDTYSSGQWDDDPEADIHGDFPNYGGGSPITSQPSPIPVDTSSYEDADTEWTYDFPSQTTDPLPPVSNADPTPDYGDADQSYDPNLEPLIPITDNTVGSVDPIDTVAIGVTDPDNVAIDHRGPGSSGSSGNMGGSSGTIDNDQTDSVVPGEHEDDGGNWFTNFPGNVVDVGGDVVSGGKDLVSGAYNTVTDAAGKVYDLASAGVGSGIDIAGNFVDTAASAAGLLPWTESNLNIHDSGTTSSANTAVAHLGTGGSGPGTPAYIPDRDGYDKSKSRTWGHEDDSIKEITSYLERYG